MEDEQTERDDWGAQDGHRKDEKGSSAALSEASGSSKDEDDAGDAESSQGYDELWCTHCMDDKGVTVCVFCGCKVSAADGLFSLFNSIYSHMICVHRNATASTTPVC